MQLYTKLLFTLGIFLTGAFDMSALAFPWEKLSVSHWQDQPRKVQPGTPVDGLVIVAPEDNAWKSAAEDLAAKLKKRTGAAVRVQGPDKHLFSDGWKGPVLIMGHLGNNIQMARLYGMRMSFADAVYPGKNGYQLLTIADPFGQGGNTLILGASDVAGCRLGVERLLQLIQGQRHAEIPYLLEARLSDETNAYFPAPKEQPKDAEKAVADARKLLERLQPALNNEMQAKALHAVMSNLCRQGEYYQLTGRKAHGASYRELLLGYARFLNQHPEAARDQLGRRNMWTNGDEFFSLWRVLEASPLFTDAERGEILPALYLTCAVNAEDGYLKRARPLAPRWNHEIFPALSLVVACDYFERYFSLPEIGQWKELGHRIFQGSTSYISLDEGSDYMMHVPMVTIDYAMAIGDLTLMNKSLRPSADLHTLMIDNLGTLSGGGDTYPFGRSTAYSWGHAQVLNAAYWHFREPLYEFLLQETRNGPFPGQGMPDLKYPIHRYTVVSASTAIEATALQHLPKVQAHEVEPGIYDDLNKDGNLLVKQPESFHKLTFRSGFGADDQYLILDGFSAGRHGHEDGNAILNYSAHGRLFLVDRDYIQKTPEYHSGVVIVKDGQQVVKPPLTKLKWVADVEGTGISRSEIPDYNSTDWERTIVSPQGKFFIIYDDLRFGESGNYLVKNLWQSLGTPKIENQMFRVFQEGATMLVQSLSSDTELRLKNIYGHFLKYWKAEYPYPYAEQENVLTEILPETNYASGARTGFINILSSHRGKDTGIRAVRHGDNGLVISDGDERWYAWKNAIRADEVSSDGSFHLLGQDELIIAATSRIGIGTDELVFKQPVFFKLNTQTGAWRTYPLLKNKAQYDQEGHPIAQQAIDSGYVSDPERAVKAIRNLVKSAEVRKAVDNRRAEATPVPENWQQTYTFAEHVTSAAVADVNADGQDELLLAGTNGLIHAIDLQGKKRWAYQAKGRVNNISVQFVSHVPYIFIATENWYVEVLDADGKERWSYLIPNDPARRESKGNLLGVTKVKLAYLNGRDQPPSVMVGTQFRYLYEFDLQGKLVNESMFYYYGLEDMAFADFDGDGKDEGAIALEYYFFALFADKKELRGRHRGPGWKVTEVLNRPGQSGASPQVLFGSKQQEVVLAGFDGKKIHEKWILNVGGDVNALVADDMDGDGVDEILVGSEGFQFYKIQPDGQTAFRKTLDDRVLKVRGFRSGSGTRYLAATAHHSLFQLTTDGATEHTYRFPSAILDVFVANAYTVPVVILENGDVYRQQTD